MSRIVFDIAAFRAAYPAFADESKYPDSMLNGYWDTAICFISDIDCGRLRGDCRERALWLAVAHIATLDAQTGTPGMASSASIDGVSVSLTPPPIASQFSWWLGLTKYGQMLLVMLRAASAGGYYVGGSRERSGFRKIGGVF